MSTDENKALVRRILEEFWNTGDIAHVDAFFAPNFVNHDPSAPQIQDREGIKQRNLLYHASFPDFHVTIEDLIAEGDLVTKRYTMRGTHQSELLGVPPTGKQVSMPGIAIYRVTNGQIQECWWNYDMLGLLQQLGVIPAPGQAES